MSLFVERRLRAIQFWIHILNIIICDWYEVTNNFFLRTRHLLTNLQTEKNDSYIVRHRVTRTTEAWIDNKITYQKTD